MKEEMIRLKNSIKMNVRYSETHGTAIILLHFGTGTSHIWNGIIPFFKDSFKIIAPDLRGHGKSDKPMDGYHIDDMANDIYFLLEELGINKCHIIGSSLGAEVGVSFASAYPDKVLSLICEGALYNEFGEYGLFNGSKSEIEQEKRKNIESFLARTKPIYKSRTELIKEESKSLQAEGLWNEYFKKFIESNICETESGDFTYCNPDHASNIYVQHYFNFKFEKYYQKIKCPVLFLPSDGEWNNERIREIMFRFANFLDKYEIKNIKDSLHAYVWMQYPEIAGKIAYDFITKIEETII